MDGRGRCLDNVFVERRWRSVKYEDVYLRGYEAVPEVGQGLGRYFALYRGERLHQSLGYRTPAQVYQQGRSAEGEVGGSYNLSHSAEENAENVLLLHDPELAGCYAAYIDGPGRRYQTL